MGEGEGAGWPGLGPSGSPLKSLGLAGPLGHWAWLGGYIMLRLGRSVAGKREGMRGPMVSRQRRGVGQSSICLPGQFQTSEL